MGLSSTKAWYMNLLNYSRIDMRRQVERMAPRGPFNDVIKKTNPGSGSLPRFIKDGVNSYLLKQMYERYVPYRNYILDYLLLD